MLGRIVNNMIGLDIRTATAGAWNTSVRYYGGHFAIASTLHPERSRYGVRFSAAPGAYVGHNRHVFHGPGFELQARDRPIAGIPFLCEVSQRSASSDAQRRSVMLAAPAGLRAMPASLVEQSATCTSSAGRGEAGEEQVHVRRRLRHHQAKASSVPDGRRRRCRWRGSACRSARRPLATVNQRRPVRPSAPLASSSHHSCTALSGARRLWPRASTRGFLYSSRASASPFGCRTRLLPDSPSPRAAAR